MKTLQNNPQFRAFASSIDYGIIVGDDKGNIVDFNEAALEMFGYTEDELRDQPIWVIVPNRFKKRESDGIINYVKYRIPRHMQMGRTLRMFGMSKTGKEFPLEVHLSEWENTKGDLYFTASLRRYSALENNLGWIIASSAIATLSLFAILTYLIIRF